MRAEDWDQRYADQQQWSSGPNALVARLLTGLPPGEAVDLAAGEGRHALWLAALGFIFYLVLRVLSPSTADKIREMIKGRPADA